MEAASRVLADPDAPRTRQEAVEQVMAATQDLAAGRGARRRWRPPGRERLAAALARPLKPDAARSQDGRRCAVRSSSAAAAPGRAAALRGSVKAKRRARRSPIVFARLPRPKGACAARRRRQAPLAAFPAGRRRAPTRLGARPPDDPPGCRRRASPAPSRAPARPRASSRPRRTCRLSAMR